MGRNQQWKIYSSVKQEREKTLRECGVIDLTWYESIHLLILLFYCLRRFVVKQNTKQVNAETSSKIMRLNAQCEFLQVCFITSYRYHTTIQYNTIQYNTIQYNTIQYNTIQYNTIQYNTIQYNTQCSISDASMEGSMTKMTFAEALKEFVVNNNEYGYAKLSQIIPFLHAKVKAACLTPSDPIREHERRVCCNLNSNNKRRYAPPEYIKEDVSDRLKKHCSESIVAPC